MTPPEDPSESSESSEASEPFEASGVRCSARGCSAPAVWALVWNNPKLHTPDRRKSWLACDAHREDLAGFLGVRGFLREVVPVEQAPVDPGPPPR